MDRPARASAATTSPSPGSTPDCRDPTAPLAPPRSPDDVVGQPDRVDSIVRGNKDHARRVNAFTIAAADRQWFRQPGSRVLTTTGTLTPLSPELVPRYSVQAAIDSQRRSQATRDTNEKIGRSMSDREASILVVNEPDITVRR